MEIEKQIEYKEKFMNNAAIVQDNKGNIIYNKDNIQDLTENHLDMAYYTAVRDGGSAYKKGENGLYYRMTLEHQQYQSPTSRIMSFLYRNQKNAMANELANISSPYSDKTGFNFRDHIENDYLRKAIIFPNAERNTLSHKIKKFFARKSERLFHRITNIFAIKTKVMPQEDTHDPLDDHQQFKETFIENHNNSKQASQKQSEGKIEFNIDKNSIKSAEIGELKTTCPNTIKQKLDEHASLTKDVKGPKIEIELHNGDKHSVRPGFASLEPDKSATKSNSGPSLGP